MFAIALPQLLLALVATAPAAHIAAPTANRYGMAVPVSPSCMLSGNASWDMSTTPAPDPCPLAQGWEVDWSVVNSTAGMWTQPAAFDPNGTWGMITLDWQSNREAWLKDDPTKATCEASMAANCAALKKAGKVRRCTIYHNMQLSLEWLESNRAVMDQAHIDAGWFLRFANGSVYNVVAGPLRPDPLNPSQPNTTFSQYFIDWRNADAAAYFVGAIVNASFLPGVDGTFTDDSNGAGMEHSTLGQLLNITNETIAEIRFATQASGNYLAQVLAANGKTCFDCIGGQVSWTDCGGPSDHSHDPTRPSFGHNQRPPPSTQLYGEGSCSEWMRNYCAPGMQGRGMFLDWDTRSNATNHAQTMAAFLITRPPVAFLGSYMLRSIDYKLFSLDVGEPLGLCDEVRGGVFQRKWTKGTATLDCHTYEATLDFKALARK
jgi:hypothetical protein